MEETKECPSCHVANPVTRVTCQVCHAKLTGKNPMEGAEIPPLEIPVKEKKVRKQRGSRRQRKIRQPQTPKEPVSEETLLGKDLPDKPARKKRQRKPKSLPMQYFALAGQTLVPIFINLQVKPMKNKDLKLEGRSLLSLWNRNKGLLK